MFKYKSKIGQGGNSEYTSLRTFIPKEVAKFLNVEQGDSIEWNVNVDENGIKIHITKKE